jgi:alpha-tubulin suppressor-like RCC1 family protein
MPFIKDISLRANKVTPTNFNLYTWGENGYGQLGTGDFTSRSSPVFITNDVTGISAGQRMVHFIKNGELWCFGNSGFDGRLGTGDTSNRSTPSQIGSLTDWEKCASGFNHSAYIRNKYLYASGDNSYGQLGNGTTTGVSSPIQIGDQEWNQIDIGGEYFCMGIKYQTIWDIGTLYAWGYNQSGQLGTGNIFSYSSPIQIGSDTDWHVVSAGYYHTIALKWEQTSTGNYSLWSWGNNVFGQLGDSTSTGKSSPVQISSEQWISISAGQLHSHGIKADGTLWSWGSNFVGESGMGNTTPSTRSSPVQVGSGTNWNAVYASKLDYATIAVKTDGTLWTWGNNQSGELGDGTTTSKSSPIQVGSGTTWVVQQEIFTQKTIAMADYFSAAIRDAL